MKPSSPGWHRNRSNTKTLGDCTSFDSHINIFKCWFVILIPSPYFSNHIVNLAHPKNQNTWNSSVKRVTSPDPCFDPPEFWRRWRWRWGSTSGWIVTAGHRRPALLSRFHGSEHQEEQPGESKKRWRMRLRETIHVHALAWAVSLALGGSWRWGHK